MKKIILGTIFLGVIHTLFGMSSVSFDSNQLLNAFPRIAECAAIAKANRMILDSNANAEIDIKSKAKVHVFCALANLCRLIDNAYSGASFYKIKDRWLPTATWYSFDNKNYYRYDFFWSMFSLLNICYHLVKYFGCLRIEQVAQQKELLAKLDEEISGITASVDSATQEVATNVQDEATKIQDVATNIQDEATTNNIQEEVELESEPDKGEPAISKRYANIKEILCIYLLPIIETACAALSTSHLHKYAFEDTALRYKFKVIQSLARILSEWLMCDQGSKKCWIYVSIFVLLIANICWDAKGYLRSADVVDDKTNGVLSMSIDDCSKRDGWKKLEPNDVKVLPKVKQYEHETCTLCQYDFDNIVSSGKDTTTNTLVAIAPCGHVFCCDCLKSLEDHCSIPKDFDWSKRAICERAKHKVETRGLNRDTALQRNFKTLKGDFAGSLIDADYWLIKNDSTYAEDYARTELTSEEYEAQSEDSTKQQLTCPSCRKELNEILYTTLLELKQFCKHKS